MKHRHTAETSRDDASGGGPDVRRLKVRDQYAFGDETVPIVVRDALRHDAWVSDIRAIDAYVARRDALLADARRAVTRAMTSTGARKIQY